MESAICRVCTLCVAQHCGCDLTPGAAPNQVAPRAVKERAFFKATLLQQQQKQQQEQEQEQEQQVKEEEEEWMEGNDGSSDKKTKKKRKKEEVDEEQSIPHSVFRGLRREEELRRGWDSRTLNRTTQAVIEDAVARERNESSSIPHLPAHELLVYLKEAAAEKMRVTMSRSRGGRTTTATTAAAAAAGAAGGASSEQQQQRQRLDGNRSDPANVLGQFDESALVALGVMVEEAVEGVVEGVLQQAAVLSWRGLYRGVRDKTPSDVKQTLRAHLGQGNGGGGEGAGGAGGAGAEAREEQEHNVLWAVFFGRTRRERGERMQGERDEDGEEDDL